MTSRSEEETESAGSHDLDGGRDRSQPFILQRSEHCISRKNISQDALKVLYRLHRFGYQAYLVGGSVRDLLLGGTPKDFDIGTNARPGQVKRLFRNCYLIGRRFRLAQIRFQSSIIEVSTFRRAIKIDPDEIVNDGKLIEDNEYGTAEEDALRRDFTVNGLFYNIADFSVIDYVNGLEDLQRRLVRTIGQAEVRFQEDPVRMVRAIRISGRCQMRLHEDILAAIPKLADLIFRCPLSRVYEDFLALLRYSSGENSIRMLVASRLAPTMLPELSSISGKESRERMRLFAFLYQCLHHLDQRWKQGIPPSDVVALGAFFLPILKLPRGFNSVPNLLASSSRDVMQAVQDLVLPFADRFAMPKRSRDRLIQILFAQKRLIELSRFQTQPGKWITRPFIPEAIDLYAIFMAAHGVHCKNYPEVVRDSGQHSLKHQTPARRRNPPPRRRAEGR